MDSVPCSSSPALPPGFSTRNLEEPALSRRGVAEAISPHSASITTKSSTRRLTYNTNRGKTGRGSASIGDTTVAVYNFLSTFTGTHYVTPRSYTAELGFHF